MTSVEDHVGRLRDAIFGALGSRTDSLEMEVRGMRSQVSLTFEQMDRALANLREIDVAPAAGVLKEAVQSAVQERQERIVLLSRFAADLRRLETQEEILDRLLDGAAAIAANIALFAVRGEKVIGLSSRGYDEDSSAGIGSYTSSTENPLFSRVLSAQRGVAVDDLSEVPGLLELLCPSATGAWLFYPMRTLGRPVAMLAAGGSEGTEAPHAESLSLMLDITALRIENLALKILQEIESSTTEAELPQATPTAVPADLHPRAAIEPLEAAPSVQPPEPAAPPEPRAAAVPPPEPEEAAPTPAAVWTGMQPSSVPDTGWGTAPADILSAEPEPAGAEAAASVPEPILEAPAPLPPEPAAPAPEMPRESVETEKTPPPAGIEEPARYSEEEKLHADAKRFARLLVSEIKLYNEQRVAEGRENWDIYVRLKRDIDRSREMYQKRVSPMVARKVDYFHDEVVRILGDNDPTALGSDYPGPLVES